MDEVLKYSRTATMYQLLQWVRRSAVPLGEIRTHSGDMGVLVRVETVAVVVAVHLIDAK